VTGRTGIVGHLALDVKNVKNEYVVFGGET
jgi:hypothetical protein